MMNVLELWVCLALLALVAVIGAAPRITLHLDRRYVAKALRRNREFVGPIEPVRSRRRLTVVR